MHVASRQNSLYSINVAWCYVNLYLLSISHLPLFPLYFLSCYLALSNLCLLLLFPFSLSPFLSVPFLLFIYLSRYYSPTPPPCLSAAAAAPPHLMDKPGPPPPSPWPPRNKRGESDPYIHPRLHRSIAAPVPLFASPSFSCCSAFSTCPRPATHEERRAGEAVAATTSPSPSPLPTTWPCPTSCVASASPSSLWATPARWRWPGLGRRRTSYTWRPMWRC